MGPKPKRKIPRENISPKKKEARNVVLAREKQRQTRARLIGGVAEEKTLKKRTSLGSESSETSQETPEEVPDEVEIKEECSSEGEGENVEEAEPETEPESEVLPGPKGQTLYYDGVGYYYTQLYEDGSNRWLQCSYGECKVMAQMRRCDKAPIQLVERSPQHEHPANPARRDRIMFLHTIKARHANETTPFSVIFQQEAHKNPVGASFFSFDKIQAHLQKKISLGGSDNLSQESVLSAASKLSMIALERPTMDTEMEPAAKKNKIDNDPPLLESQSKKFEKLKSLKDLSVSESELKETSSPLPGKSSERVPGTIPHTYLYHDGSGNFYKPLSVSENTRHLICNTMGCQARAVMALEENAPITAEMDSPAHNHHTPGETQRIGKIRPVNIQSLVEPGKENQITGEHSAQNDEAIRMRSSMVVLNKFPTPAQPPKKFSGFVKLEGPEYFYDFRGYYYFSTKIESNKKILRCLRPTCLAQAMMTLDGEPEIQPISGSRPHNHPPSHTDNHRKQMKQWEEQWSECLPSERLPSLRVRYSCYHDGRGYYYHQTSQVDDVRHLACIEPKCLVKAFMNTLKDSLITISGLRMGHNHGPDHTLREALLFIDAVKVRMRCNFTPDNAINKEAQRNPVGAGRVNLNALKMCLEQAVELAKGNSKFGMVEDEVDFASCVKSRFLVSMKPSTESQIPVPNHFTSPTPNLEDYPEKEEEEKRYTKPELVPALLSDSWLYHDGCGYYYNTLSISSGYRYLQCVLPKCNVQAVAALAGGPVKPCKPHSHGPQPPQHQAELWFLHRIKVRAQKSPDTPIDKIYKEVAAKDPLGASLVSLAEIIQLMNKYLISIIKGNENRNAVKIQSPVHVPSLAEVLPTTSGQIQYHDGKGYYYVHDNTVKKSPYITLKCSYRATCTARAYLENGKVKMNLSTRHNHRPDRTHRDICFFSLVLKKRARDEKTPLSVIYEEETKRFPKAAAVLQQDKIKDKLISIRQYVKREVHLENEQEDFEDIQRNDQARPYVASEMFPGKAKNVYHDGRGYFYHETFATKQMRFLMCCEPHCLAQAKMGLMTGSPVISQVGAPRHCHAPDPLRRNFLQLIKNVRQSATQYNVDPETLYQQETAKEPIVAAQIPKDYLYNLIINVRRCYKKIINTSVNNKDTDEDKELWRLSEQGERLPSQHGWLYYNSRGYFYYSHDTDKSQKRRILRCCEEGCEATASLEDGTRVVRAPGSLLHNHTPEPRRLTMLLLLHRVATRAQLEHASVGDIYNEEAQRDPVGAALIPKNRLNKILWSLTDKKYFKVLEEEELALKEEINEETLRELQVMSEPCEVLPSASSDQPVYHDSAGNYYTDFCKRDNRQYVKCMMPLCKAWRYIEELMPWKLHVPMQWREHNHKNDLRYREKLIFLDNVRRRALNENTPVDVIYREECMREPLGAERVHEVSIKNLMYKLRKSTSVGDDSNTFPYEDCTELANKGVVEKASVPESTIQPQINVGHSNKDVECHKDAANKPAAVQESVGVADEDDDDEYLEEERLEDEGEVQREIESTCEMVMPKNQKYFPTEKIQNPNSRLNSFIYHNGQGYYFLNNGTKDGKMYMKCLEPNCKVRGIKSAERDDAPIFHVKLIAHNHPPDFIRRRRHNFVKRCKDRAAAELNLSIDEIWNAEAAREPEIASQFIPFEIKGHIQKHRIQHMANSDVPSTRDTQENSSDGVMFHDASITDPVPKDEPHDGVMFHDVSITGPVPKDEPHVDIHHSTVPEKVPSLVGNILWYADGYFYSTCKITGFVEEVKCVEKDCPARAQVSLGSRDKRPSIQPIPIFRPHSHPADLQRKDQLLFIDRCKRRAATTLQSVDEIYYDEASKVPEVAAQLSAVRVKRAMGIAKKEMMKKGARLDSKGLEGSGGSGDHGMSELGEMTKGYAPAVTCTEEAGAGDSGAQDDNDHYGPEETLDESDELWVPNLTTLSPEAKLERRKALARERQRRRRLKLVEDPEKWEQLERERQQSRERALLWQRQKRERMMQEKYKKSGPKTSPLLGPKFLKELVQMTNEEGPQEEEVEEESVDQTYSDYVTLEEEVESKEEVISNEGEEKEESRS